MAYWTISNPGQIKKVLFKPCKKTADFYSEEIEGLLYKKPYKYYMKFFAGDERHEMFDDAEIQVKLIYDNGEEVTDEGAIQNVVYIWSEEGGFFEIGPFFYTICSYKHQKRMFRLLAIVKVDDKEICKIESRKFLIKAKKTKKKKQPISPVAAKVVVSKTTSPSHLPSVFNSSLAVNSSSTIGSSLAVNSSSTVSSPLAVSTASAGNSSSIVRKVNPIPSSQNEKPVKRIIGKSVLIRRNEKSSKMLERKKLLPIRLRRNWQIA